MRRARDRSAPLPIGTSFEPLSETASVSETLAGSLKDLALKYWAKGDLRNALRVGQEALEVLGHDSPGSEEVAAIETLLEQIKDEAEGPH